MKHFVKIFIFFSALILPPAEYFELQAKSKMTVSKEYRLMKTVRFNVYYPEGLERSAIRAASEAEKACIRAAFYLQHDLTRVLPIILYDGDFPPENTLLQQTFYPFLSYCILVNINEQKAFTEIARQIIHAFQYNILLADNSGKLMNRNNCGLIEEWFLIGMAEYLSLSAPASKYHDSFLALEKNYGKKIFGELLREARDTGSLKRALIIHTGKDKIEDIVSSGISSEENETHRDANTYGETIFNFHESVFSPYESSLRITEKRVGFTTAPSNIYAASAYMLINSELDTFSIMFHGGFLQHGNSSSPEFDITARYGTSKARLNASVYGKTFPFSAPMVYPDTFYHEKAPAQGCDSMKDYGLAFGMLWLFTSSFDAAIGVKLHRYEGDDSDKSDFRTTLTEPYVKLNYERSGDLSSIFSGGIKGNLLASRAVSIGGKDISYYRLEASLAHYIAITRKHSLTLSAFYGRVFDDDKNYFKYYAGGLESLRASSLGEYEGHETFLFNSEINFAVLDSIRTRGFLPRTVSSVKLAAFADVGAVNGAGKGASHITDGGLGLRFVFYPSVILRLDFVSPLKNISWNDTKLYFNFGASF